MAGKPKPLPTPPKPAPKPVPAPVPKPPAPNPGATWGQAQQSVFDLMKQTLADWGISTLAGDLKNLIVRGDTSPDTLKLALSQTDAYKQRFIGNEIRKKNGFSELLPADYIAAEDGYRQVMRAYGIPSGFYDSQDDLTKFIGNNVSPHEMEMRVQAAHDQYMAAAPEYKQMWQQYGFSKGDAIAAILDPNVATQTILDRAQQVAIGATALQNGFNVNQSRAQQFQQNGVTLDQARQAYQRISQIHTQDQQIAKRFGTTFDQTDEENDLLLGNGAAGQKRQTLYDSEQALFRGGIGSQNALGTPQSNY